MAPPVPSFPDRLAVITAELAALGKRPVSATTHAELVRLNGRLDALVNEFIMCDRCGNLFPQVAQVTLGGRTANLCSSCGITALQKGAIELAADRHARAGHAPARRASRTTPAPSRPGGPTRGTKEVTGADAVSARGEVQLARATGKRKSAAPEKPSGNRSEDTGASEASQAAPPVSSKAAPAAHGENAAVSSEAKGSVPGQTMAGLGESAPEEGAPDESSPSIPRRTAKRATNDKSPFMATVPDVAKFLKRPPGEVRQISRLIEEISPPMNTEKTKRYVAAELRNTRSKIPVEIIAKVVETLKDGIPGGDKADGG